MQCNLLDFDTFLQPREIKGFNNYTISCSGTVFNKIQNRNLKPSKSDLGYYYVRLRNYNGVYKHKYIHRLVAEAFLGNHYFPGAEVNHIDGNRANNHVSNLEWVSHQKNIKYSFDVLGRDMWHAEKPVYITDIDRYFKSYSDAARFLKCTNSQISIAILTGRKVKGHTIIDVKQVISQYNALNFMGEFKEEKT